MSFHLCRNYKKLPLSERPYVGVDIENDPEVGGADSFLHGHLFGKYLYRARKGKRGVQEDIYELRDIDEHFTIRKEMTNRILSFHKKGHGRLPFTLVFFNASYDYTFLQDICDDSKRLMNGSRFISGRTKTGIPMLDILNHYKDGSLETAMKNFDMEKRFGVKKLSLETSVLADRNRFDAMATYYLAEEFRRLYNEAGVDLKCTAPANALLLFQTKFMPDNFAVHREDEEQYLNDFERKSYFGGRNEVFVRGNAEIVSYDVHSMYPSVMAENEYPDPMSGRHYIDGADNHYERWYYDSARYLGIYAVTVDVPETNIPVLGVKRVIGKSEKLVFPTGIFSGVWTSEELRYAEECGVKILSCSEFIVYKKSLPLFERYINYCWKKRSRAKKLKDKPMDDFWKLMMNSLYGKFAERHRSGGYFGKAEDADWSKITLAGKRIIDHVIQGVPFISIPDDKEGKDSNHTIPCISSFVTAYSRLKLTKAMHRLEKAGYRVCYTDTDSIKIACRNLKDKPKKSDVDRVVGAGHKLGEFGYEPEHSGLFHFIGQKSYGPVVDGKLDFEHSRLKGVKKSWEKTFEGDLKVPGSVVITGTGMRPISEKQAIISKDVPKRWKEDRKVVSGHGDKRTWRGQYSRPVVLEEVVPPPTP